MRITTLGTSHGAAEPGRFCCATLVDAGGEAALALRDLLEKEDALSGREQGECSYYASDRVEDFERLASLFLSEDLHESAKEINIEHY